MHHPARSLKTPPALPPPHLPKLFFLFLSHHPQQGACAELCDNNPDCTFYTHCAGTGGCDNARAGGPRALPRTCTLGTGAFLEAPVGSLPDGAAFDGFSVGWGCKPAAVKAAREEVAAPKAAVAAPPVVAAAGAAGVEPAAAVVPPAPGGAPTNPRPSVSPVPPVTVPAVPPPTTPPPPPPPPTTTPAVPPATPAAPTTPPPTTSPPTPPPTTKPATRPVSATPVATAVVELAVEAKEAEPAPAPAAVPAAAGPAGPALPAGPPLPLGPPKAQFFEGPALATTAGASLPACIQSVTEEAAGYRFCQGKGTPPVCGDGSERGTCVVVGRGSNAFTGDGKAGWVSGVRAAKPAE